MNRKFTVMLCSVASALAMKAQVQFTENFTAPFTPTAAGWAMLNLSAPAGTNTAWFQGAANVFPAYNGAPTDYFASNFGAIAANQSGTISSWLFSPTTNSITDGGIFQFATRTSSPGATAYPDRLQVYYSTAGTGTNVGATATSLGTYTNLILDINPNLTTNTNSAVVNGTVNGYPIQWTVYTMTLSGVTGTQTGRFAFRYFVTNGGPNGANSDFIGVDAVTYSVPCVPPTLIANPSSTNICSGGTANLSVTGGTSYIWAPGNQTTAAVAVTPSATTVYTVTGFAAGTGCPGTTTLAVNVTPTPTITANNATICAGTTASLMASGAPNFSWQPGGETTSSITVSPGATTNYTVIGINGSCQSSKVVTVTVGANLGVNIVPSSTNVCSGGNVTLTANGAQSYSWSTGSTSSSIVVTPSVTTTYSVGGVIPPSCFGGGTIAINVTQTPTVSASSNPSVICSTSPTGTLTAAGATNYTWSLGAQSFTVNPLPVTTPTTPGTYTLNLVGTSNGCLSQVYTASITVITCTATGIAENRAAVEAGVFPNPFSNEITITGIKGSVNVCNAIGQVVLSSAINETEPLNTSSLPKGIYFVKAYDSEGTLVKTIKVIKN